MIGGPGGVKSSRLSTDMSKRKIAFKRGDVFGSRALTSDYFIAPSGRTSYHYACTQCGTVGIMSQGLLRQSVSCCNQYMHKGRDRLRIIWDDMNNRCYDRGHPAYARYGGRGLGISGWDGYPGFKTWALKQGYQHSDKVELDRVNNEEGYYPENCRFVSSSVNARNRRSTRFITAFGETLPLVVWSERTEIQAQTIAARIDRYGWTPEDALSR